MRSQILTRRLRLDDSDLGNHTIAVAVGSP